MARKDNSGAKGQGKWAESNMRKTMPRDTGTAHHPDWGIISMTIIFEDWDTIFIKKVTNKLTIYFNGLFYNLHCILKKNWSRFLTRMGKELSLPLL
ncbi:hypothetical protein B5F76_03165 [Desulfovibrio sp. An276]|uniref:hypothetical protein n=1 Tax=Desulfovibrio sp. An276 TaxID=1965618 RepID=UPI000B3953F2|nr:hypothetical protein [Desulfovibrio sp. An276]OUO54457.1 hypothetical protein B5F76_03165 [Desulfovibrio sp. An276]